MTSLNTTTAAPWYLTLTESVHSLGAAAREYRVALQTAEYGVHRTAPYRDQHTGELAAPGGLHHRPHEMAQTVISDLFADVEERLRAQYENTARAYAHGAAWAICSVLAGRKPARVVLPHEWGRYVVAGEVAEFRTGLLGWSCWERLDARRMELARRETAREVADALLAEQDFTEPESATLTAARDTADGLALAAMDYGELAQSALQCAIDRARTGRLPKA